MVSTKPSPEVLRTWGHGLLRTPWRIWFPAPQGPFRGFSPWRPNNRCLLLPVLPSGNLTWKKPWKIGQSMEHLWTTMERSTIANSWVNQLFLWTMASSSQTVSLPEGFFVLFQSLRRGEDKEFSYFKVRLLVTCTTSVPSQNKPKSEDMRGQIPK